MGPREIPALSVLALRTIGNPKCKADETFKPTKDGKPSSASRLLRSFHKRPVLGSGETMSDFVKRESEAVKDIEEDDDIKVPTLERIPMKRTPAIGGGSGRRKQANDVDLNHPWIATYLPQREETEEENESSNSNDDNVPANPLEQTLVASSGSCALDLLQSYADALVEMGRMDDNRLGLKFFAEYKANIELQYKASLPLTEDSSAPVEAAAAEATPEPEKALEPAASAPIDAPIPRKKKRKRSGGGAFSAAKKKKEAEAKAAAEAKRQAAILAAVPKSRGSLSLHNCEVLVETSSNLITSRLLEHIHILDLTGLQTLTDDVLLPFLKSAGLQLERLSVKNCRRLTDISVHNMCEYCPNLQAIDLGGDYNIWPRTVIDALAVKVTKRGRGVFTSQALPHLVELHAGGIGPTGGWSDDLLPELFALRGWKALSIGFSPYLTFAGWKTALLSVEQKHKEEQEQAEAQPPEGSAEGVTPEDANKKNETKPKANTNMCQTLQSLGIAFCEHQLVDNAWLGLVGRHLPNLRALDVRGNHSVNSMTSWYDGRATISTSSGTKVHPKQSLVVLARYSGVSANSIEETKRIYAMAAAPLTVSTESDGIGLGILRQAEQQGTDHKDHYQKRLAAAKEAAKAKKESKEKPNKSASATPETITKVVVPVVVPPEEESVGDVKAKEGISQNAPVAMETN
eukprot:CAMPEP_0116123602 /NCGR_PEP_ID=MMETSP0329-20121206/4834_1 /TAXON_ID=697910 /ORGANISM="Pseudo-nitzschia arenysensis, Strain B593" /LENGTH=686 /DNA_ID=CAMNT_0003617525 /DNA_START=133 /DNA_END=2193 /DNA_ORIENTATION=-